ncbi:MAG TPA: SDR family oxidoreductase, partial [Clostridia bacterium]|nr:SDR family oxidoreductase [Clostridia bacterium]
MELLDLHGKKALVTGASRGIGKAIAIALAKEGANLALSARSLEALKPVIDEAIALGVNAKGFACDLTDASAPVEMLNEAFEFLGGLDILINNAGIAIPAKLEHTTVGQWDAHMNINLRAPFLLSQAALPALRRSDMPVIINISSVTGIKGYVSQGA